MAINYDELGKALRTMNERQKLFQIVKEEMERRGHWKPKPRGHGFKKGDDARRKPLKPINED